MTFDKQAKERFDKRFKHSDYCLKKRKEGHRYCSCDYDEFLDFLSQILQEQREEIIKRVEALEPPIDTDGMYKYGHEFALQQVIKEIKEI